MIRRKRLPLALGPIGWLALATYALTRYPLVALALAAALAAGTLLILAHGGH